jgi:2-polyprenyl-6-methoxyphenol hydroxylase-like FAD-dependent oxidoreductase
MTSPFTLTTLNTCESLLPPMDLHLGSLTVKWVMQKPAPADPGTPYPNILLLPQYGATQILRRAVEEAGVTVEFGTKVTGIAQDKEFTTAVLTDGQRVRAHHIVGADGGISIVRKSADLAFDGTTDEEDRMIIVDGQVEGLPRDRWHVFPQVGGRMVAACPLPGAATSS